MVLILIAHCRKQKQNQNQALNHNVLINFGLGELKKANTKRKSTHHLWHLINLMLVGWIFFFIP